MRILDIRERAVDIRSSQRNSRFDFSQMDTSVVAVMSDVVRDGQRLCGYAFNSFGRYNCSAMVRATTGARRFPSPISAYNSSMLRTPASRAQRSSTLISKAGRRMRSALSDWSSSLRPSSTDSR